jgi:hypothetical protein
LICSFNFLIFLAVCLNISTVINIKILTNSNQQTQSYKFTSHIAAYLSVVLITVMLEICIKNIIWSKRSTDFKELSPCSVWYPLKKVNTKMNTYLIIIYCEPWLSRSHYHWELEMKLSWFLRKLLYFLYMSHTLDIRLNRSKIVVSFYNDWLIVV